MVTVSVVYRLPLYSCKLYSKYNTLFSGSCLVTVNYRVTAMNWAVILRFDCISNHLDKQIMHVFV